MIIALLKFAVNVNVFDIKASKVLEDFIVWPVFDILNKVQLTVIF